jgi:hypothetical protein
MPPGCGMDAATNSELTGCLSASASLASRTLTGTIARRLRGSGVSPRNSSKRRRPPTEVA